MLGQQRPQRNDEKPNGKTTTAITCCAYRAVTRLGTPWVGRSVM